MRLPGTTNKFRAKTNAERQREFCRRNPGYYARLKAASRGLAKRSIATQSQHDDAAMATVVGAQAETMAIAPPKRPAEAVEAVAPTGC